MNLRAFGRSYGPSFGALDVEDLLEKAKEEYGGMLEDLGQPSQGLAKDIGEQLVETHGEAAAREVWAQARPFAIAAVAVLGIIAVAVITKRKK